MSKIKTKDAILRIAYSESPWKYLESYEDWKQRLFEEINELLENKEKMSDFKSKIVNDVQKKK